MPSFACPPSGYQPSPSRRAMPQANQDRSDFGQLNSTYDNTTFRWDNVLKIVSTRKDRYTSSREYNQMTVGMMKKDGWWPADSITSKVILWLGPQCKQRLHKESQNDFLYWLLQTYYRFMRTRKELNCMSIPNFNFGQLTVSEQTCREKQH